MKRVLVTAFHMCLIAVAWIMLSWFSFNSLALGAPESSAPAVAANKGATPQDDSQRGDCGKGWHHHKGRHHGMHRFLEKLNLTDAQKDQIHAIVTEERANIKPLVQKLKEGRNELRAATKEGAFDEQQVRSLASKQASTITEMIVAKQRMKARIFKVLTPEQRAQAQKLRESWIGVFAG